MGAHEASTLLTGSCHTRLGQMLCKAAGFTNQRAADLTDGDLERIARQTQRFALPITGTCGFDQARTNLTRRRWRAALCRGFTPAARCWTWTATAAASICSGRGRPGIWRDSCCEPVRGCLKKYLMCPLLVS